MTILLDTSALVPIFIAEKSTPSVMSLFRPPGIAAIVTDFAALEFAAALSRLHRMTLINSAQADDVLAAFDDWVAEHAILSAIQPVDIVQADEFVRQFDLKLHAPDAIHLAACRRLSARLVTLDRRMSDAAMALGIPLQPLATN
jgi:uncharacterized protein